MRLCFHRVLIVEDEFFIAAELEDVISETGAKIIGPAMSSPHALRLLEDNDVTLAILDVQLGDHDSFLVARYLTTARIPFLFHTANVDTDYLFKNWPLAPVLKKPAEHSVLLAAMIALTDVIFAA